MLADERARFASAGAAFTFACREVLDMSGLHAAFTQMPYWPARCCSSEPAYGRHQQAQLKRPAYDEAFPRQYASATDDNAQRARLESASSHARSCATRRSPVMDIRTYCTGPSASINNT